MDKETLKDIEEQMKVMSSTVYLGHLKAIIEAYEKEIIRLQDLTKDLRQQYDYLNSIRDFRQKV